MTLKLLEVENDNQFTFMLDNNYHMLLLVAELIISNLLLLNLDRKLLKIKIVQVEIDFVAEAEQISQTLSAHAAAHSSRDVDEAMKYWLRLEKPKVFMAQHGWGALMTIEKWSGIKVSFEETQKKIGRNPIPGLAEQVGIDSRAKNATVRGKMVQNWGGATSYLATLGKD